MNNKNLGRGSPQKSSIKVTTNPSLAFNTLLEEFILKMIKTFPERTKLKIWYTQFKATKSIDSKAPMNIFIQPLVDYGIHIMKKDENFFKQDNFVNNAESFSKTSGLIDVWDNTNQQVKDAIWGYIQSLYVISMTGTNNKEKLQEILNSI